jgi:hypothetical protein
LCIINNNAWYARTWCGAVCYKALARCLWVSHLSWALYLQCDIKPSLYLTGWEQVM